MKELELSYYFKEINEFRFKDVFKNCKYPWEALANINKYIVAGFWSYYDLFSSPSMKIVIPNPSKRLFLSATFATGFP